MHEMTNNRFKVLRRESSLHFDSGMRTKDDGMGLEDLHIELDILMWVDGNLIESNFMDIKHTRAGIEGACGERVTESGNEGCEKYPGARKNQKWQAASRERIW